jgi:hypothetical protein
MATKIPYILMLNSTLAASGQGTAQYQVPPGQTLEINKLFYTAQGIFNVTGIRNGGSILFSNISASNPIPSTMLANIVNQFNVFEEMNPPLVILGGDTFYIDLLDTSGNPNTVRLLLSTQKTQN